ncbi:MAG TPA: low molecular weight protein-tyrosine-phosphatase [Acidimicrobiia bacterium]|nr:low molecular weight protein-tyrosine-phosphatase [Acidimicrobiia bacterium]
MTVRILAVCAGNICRSPVAAAAIETAAAKAGFAVEVDSAGTGSWNLGEPPHPKTVAASAGAGLEVRGRARKINQADFDRFDVIVVMDKANLRDVVELAPGLEDRAKVRLFRTFDPLTDHEEVADPYGGSDDDYDAMVQQVTAAAQGLVDSLVSGGVQGPVTPR